MTVQSSLLAVRAIGAAFARRLWWTGAIWAFVPSVILIMLLLWLTSLNSWWWLLALPIGIGISVALVLLAIFHLLINHVRPVQTAAQKTQVANFVEKLQFASEITSTPKIIMLFRTVRSIAAPKSDRYLQNIFETKDLKKDFQDISRSFQSE